MAIIKEIITDISFNDGSLKISGFVSTVSFVKELLRFPDLLQNALNSFKYSVSDFIIL